MTQARSKLNVRVAPPAPAIALAFPSTRLLRENSTYTVATGTGPAIPFDTVAFDDKGWANLSADATKITVTQAGRYMVAGCLAWEDINSSGFPITQHILQNGNQIVGNQLSYTVGSPGTLFTLIFTVAQAGDYFQLQAFQGSGGDMHTWYPGYVPLGIQPVPQLTVVSFPHP